MNEENNPTTPHRLPDFANREQLAEFWDTHSFTNFLNDLEPGKAQIAEEVAAPLTTVTQVRLDKETDQQACYNCQAARDSEINPSSHDCNRMAP